MMNAKDPSPGKHPAMRRARYGEPEYVWGRPASMYLRVMHTAKAVTP
jgi:hypothetical protein